MTDYATLAETKAYLEIGDTSQDVLLARLITAASAAIDKYCSRALLTASYTEERPGSGTACIEVTQYPITALASVTIDDVAVSASYLKYSGSVIRRTDGGTFDAGSEVEIAYTAGLASIPEDITQACIEIVAWRFSERDRIGQSSKSAGGAETVAYQTIAIPNSAKAALDAYRRVMPVVW